MALISEAYREEQKRLHATGKYGVAARAFGGAVSAMVEANSAHTLLDYGCGSKRSLLGALEVPVAYVGYDPAVPGADVDPPACDAVACIDVLEHIEPENLDAVLDHIKAKMLRVGLFSIHTGPAIKVLSDGRNAHLIQEPARWWLAHLIKRWHIQALQPVQNGFVVLVKSIL